MSRLSPSIQSFIPSVGNVVEGFFPRWSAGKVVVGNDLTGDGTLRFFRFDLDSGAEEALHLLTGSQTNETFGVSPDGDIAISSSGISNFCSFIQLDQGFTQTATYGVFSAFWNVPAGLPFPINGWAAQEFGGTKVYVGTTSRPLLDPVSGVTGYMVWALQGFVSSNSLWWFTQDPIIEALPGKVSETEANFFCIGGPSLVGDPQFFRLYSLQIGGDNLGPVQLGVSKTPADIDPAWTHFTHSGGVYDATDGNVLVILATSDAVANKAYVCKFNAVTGALMWKVVERGGSTGPGFTRYGRVTRGKFAWFMSFGGVNSVSIIDTIAGVEVLNYSAGLTGVTGSQQSFDDTTGAIMLVCDAFLGAGSPARRNATPVSWSGQVAALYVLPQAISYADII